MFFCFFVFFNDTATTEIYTYWHTLSLHDALPSAIGARKSSSLVDRHVVARVVAGVDLPRAADLELRVFLLFEPVRDPAGGAGDGEHHREHLGRDAQRL